MIAVFRDLCIDGTTRHVFLQAGPDGGPSIFVNGVPEAKTVEGRIHLDVTLEPGLPETDASNDADAEVAL